MPSEGYSSAAPAPCAIADRLAGLDRSTRGALLDASDTDVIGRLFGDRVINDGAGMIQLDVPLLARPGASVPVSVQVNWSLVLTKAVARLYVIADGNRDALLAAVSLIPDLVPPHVCLSVRLDGSTAVRAVVECGDGSLLQVRHWVRVVPHDLDACEANGALGRPSRQEDGPDMTSERRRILIGDGDEIGCVPGEADAGREKRA